MSKSMQANPFGFRTGKEVKLIPKGSRRQGGLQVHLGLPTSLMLNMMMKTKKLRRTGRWRKSLTRSWWMRLVA